MKNNKAGFTLIEMIFCISVILVILLLVIPNVTRKNDVVKGKGCEAQVKSLIHRLSYIRLNMMTCLPAFHN